MKIATWNVRGICSSYKRYSMWKTVFISQWDVLCAVEHKEHARSGSSLQYKQYHVFYAGVIGGLYSGIMLIIRDNLKPMVVQRDVHGRFLVVEVNYEGNTIWVVGIYAPNVAGQRINLWRALHQVLRNGRPGFLLGDFNMCSEVGQSTSMHGVMDAPEREVWDLFMMEVLRYDAWTWINGHEVGYTFQSAQHRSTWSRLDRIYIMHDETFLPSLLTMQVYRGIGLSDHFPIVLDCTHQTVDDFRSLLGKPPLRFTSSFLGHNNFKHAMGQLVEELTRQVNVHGLSAWDVCLSNIQRFTRYYGIHQASIRKQKMSLVQQFLDRCNALLVKCPFDDVLLDIQEALSHALQVLQVCSYQRARVMAMKSEVHDHNCHSHKFFHGLHASHARMNVVCVEIDGTLNTNPQVIIDECVKHFKNLFGQEGNLNDDITQARSMFFNSVTTIGGQHDMRTMEEDIQEEEVEYVLSHLSVDKSPGWDGITNEFFKAFVQELKGPLTMLFQDVWSSGQMPDSWKIGLVKLIPKVASPMSFAQWRPISLMGGLYKIFAKVIANRLQKVLSSVVHPMQYGFIKGRDILHNILNVQMAVDYAKESKQQIVMIQLDIEKAYDHVNWSFINQLLSHMGFGERMSRVPLLVGFGAVSHIMLNGGVTKAIPLARSLRQGCPLSPLLFAIATHPILVKMHELATCGEIVGLALPSGKQLIAQALADDSFLFLKAEPDNIAKAMEVWNVFALASGLHINMRKSMLIRCTESDLVDLGWCGQILDRGNVCRHLGYPIGVDISTSQSLNWISGTILDKFMYWKSQAWPFSTRLKVVQAIMIPMISYFLPLLPWTKKSLDRLARSLKYTLWKKESRLGMSWVSWNNICTPKRLGGVALLNLEDHMVARRFNLLKGMCIGTQPWAEIIRYFVEKVGIYHGKTRISTSWWHVINSTRVFKCSESIMVQQLVLSWQRCLELFHWSPPECRKDTNSLAAEVLASSRLLHWEGKESLNTQFNRMARLGLVTVEDGILQSCRKMMAFRTVRNKFHIPRGYGYIWESILTLPRLVFPIPMLLVADPWKDWSFGIGQSLFVVNTNDVYHKLVEDRAWLETKVANTWYITRHIKWWTRVLDAGWQSRLPFRAKVFLWRVIVGGLPLAMALKRRNISNGTCFFCTVVDEDARHRFITCPVAKAIWVVISQIWASITGNILSPFNWVFIDDDKGMPAPSYKVVFDYLRYWGLWFNWTMRNGFLFDGLHGGNTTTS